MSIKMDKLIEALKDTRIESAIKIKAQKPKKAADEYKKQIQEIVTNLKIDIDDLLNEFDNEEMLTEDDADIIKEEYDDVLKIAYDSIEHILKKFPTDLLYYKIIERKIELIDDKVNRFLRN